MQFNKSIQEGYAKKVLIDNIRAKSLIKTADNALLSAKELQMIERNYNSILRELYESLRQYCEAIGYLKGYKFESHEVITYFLNDMLDEKEISMKFDRYRQLRNGINYYGRGIAKETAEKAIKEIPDIIKKLKKHIKL
ncbi:hypothetical protein J4440_01650 [Candidatus Woesearchaeota archaeon]|nr:hypothetical protein [Candidatus Woesearchaeota archaeon]